MRIAILGYGKMGQTIERIASERSHDIALVADDTSHIKDLKKADVAIEFSTPDSAFDNLALSFKNQVPVVCGTTAWLNRYEEAVELCNKHQGAFIYASNFSLGVNLFFQLNKYLSQMMNTFDEQYQVSIEEHHHTQKIDAPSGTAITLAEAIIEDTDKTGWQLDKAEVSKIPIKAKRIDKLPGTHIVNYKSAVDEIEIKHTAKSRDGFALGAVIAAEWIVGKQGVFTMKDVLNIK